MPIGEQADQKAVDQAILTDEHATDLGPHRVQKSAAFLDPIVNGGGIGHASVLRGFPDCRRPKAAGLLI